MSHIKVNYTKSDPWSWIVCSSLFVLLMSSPVHFFGYRYILLGLVPLLLCLFASGFGLKSNIKLTVQRLFYIVFLFMCLASIIMARNLSLVWFPIFTWVILFIWFEIVGHFGSNETFIYRVKCIFNALFVIMTCQIVIFLTLTFFYKEANFYNSFGIVRSVAEVFNIPSKMFVLDFDRNLEVWNRFFGYNRNHTCSLYIMLYTYILYDNRETWMCVFSKVIGFLVILLLLYRSTSVGCSMLFVFTFLFYLFSRRRDVFQIKFGCFLKSILGIIFVIIVPLLLWDSFHDNSISLSGSTLVRHSTGYFSLLLFLENPLLGVGLGNWPTEVYKYISSESAGLGNTHELIRLGSHNFYASILSEVGLVGFFAFLGFVLYSIGLLFYGLRKQGGLQIAILSNWFLYIIGLCFYESFNSHGYHFSGVQFLAFFGMAMATGPLLQRKLISIQKYIFRFISFCLIIVCLLWFVYSRVMIVKLSEAVQAKEGLKSLELYENIYDKNFYIGNGTEVIIPLEMARLYVEEGDVQKANLLYNEALSLYPYDEEILIEFCYFGLNEMSFGMNIDKQIETLEGLQTNYYLNRLVRAEYYLEKEMYIESSSLLLDLPWRYSDNYLATALSYRMLFDGLLEDLVALTNTEEVSLKKNSLRLKSVLNNLRNEENLLRQCLSGADKGECQSNFARFDRIFLELKVVLFHLIDREKFYIVLEFLNKRSAKNDYKVLNNWPGLTPIVKERLLELMYDSKLKNQEVKFRLMANSSNNTWKDEYKNLLLFQELVLDTILNGSVIEDHERERLFKYCCQ